MQDGQAGLSDDLSGLHQRDERGRNKQDEGGGERCEFGHLRIPFAVFRAARAGVDYEMPQSVRADARAAEFFFLFFLRNEGAGPGRRVRAFAASSQQREKRDDQRGLFTRVDASARVTGCGAKKRRPEGRRFCASSRRRGLGDDQRGLRQRRDSDRREQNQRDGESGDLGHLIIPSNVCCVRL